MPTLRVLDLSHHNDGPGGGAIDFAAIAAFGVRGIIHKASQGTLNVDRMYERRRQAAVDAGLLWGAYHFAEAQDADTQVKHFMDAAQPEEGTLMALDFEPYGNNTMSLPGARRFLQTLDEALGRKAVIYSGNLIKETLGNKPDDFLGGHRLWLAQYGPVARVPAAWKSYWLWQFSGDGINNQGISIPGVNPTQAKRLDMNAYDGGDEQLAAEWAGDPLAPAAPVA